MAPLSAIRAPAPLRDLQGWLTWQFEENPDPSKKPLKVPYYASGHKRTTNGSDVDRARLVTFDVAMAAAIKHGRAGVGFAPLPEFNIVALDFDDCFDEDGNLDPDVARICSRTYSEKSPSGNGIRAFFRGSLGNHKRHKGEDGAPYGFEAFSTKGYVTLTGDILGACEMVGLEDTIAELDQFTIDYAEKRFGRLDGPEFDPDDFTLGMKKPLDNLTFEQMEAWVYKLPPGGPREPWLDVGMGIHHQTGGSEEGFNLWDEWSKTAGPKEYGGEDELRSNWTSFNNRMGERRPQKTMATVIKRAKAISPEEILMRSPVVIGEPGLTFTTPDHWEGKFAIQSVTDLVNRPPPRWFIKGVLPRAGLGMLFGDSTSGKTFLALDMACAIARGVDWHGRRTKQARVLYIVAEGGGSFSKRLAAYCVHNGITTEELSVNFGLIDGQPNLLEATDVTRIIEAVAIAGGADLIYIDTLAQATPGGDENSAEAMGSALGNVRTIRNHTGADVILVHHTGKDASRGARGWSGIRAAVDVEIEVSHVEGQARCMRISKMKDAEAGLKFYFSLGQIALGVDEEGDPYDSCIVLEEQTPAPTDNTIIAKEPKSRDPFQNHILEVIEGVDTSLAGMPLDALAALSAGMLTPPEPGQRDARLQQCTRAIRELAKGSGAPLGIDNNFVVFYK